AKAVRGSAARITVRCEEDGHSIGTIRHPADEDSAAAAAFRVATKATSPAPADSSGATAVSSFSPSPSNVAPSHSANSRTRMPLMIALGVVDPNYGGSDIISMRCSVEDSHTN